MQTMSSNEPLHNPEERDTWSLSSWRKYPAKQQPQWPDQADLEKSLRELREYSSIVVPEDVERLNMQLDEVACGNRFLLHGGDCVETFADATYEIVTKKLDLLVKLKRILEENLNIKCTTIGRIAGQYAKPRSNQIDEDGLPVFRGEMINGFQAESRTPDPKRLLQAYKYSSETLDHCKKYFSKESNKVASNEFFTSHEGLLLDYEEAGTRSINGSFYNLTSHYIWVGDRTRQVDHAHLEYVRGLKNPIGIKVGPTMLSDELIKVIKRLNSHEKKITLITRYGVANVENILPLHIDAVKSAGFTVIWSCDPCHGNTKVTQAGYKTRYSDQ
ncbi:phospho-2-dehydro-3-deoxyheptonate aldolase isoform X2 [Folsomia candida]|nr:phospho-2-dehydro-3-deoxyheptonate aldolase isoform X2 [Folsomia candida]